MKRFLKIILKKIFRNSFGKSVSRISLNKELSHQFKKLKPGIVLDVGAKHSPYLESIPSVKYMSLDISPENNPDICCDLHDIRWQANYFDTIIATEVLEHLQEPQKAINEIHRILKANGACILSTRFICPYHPDPKDYYRFTQDSLRYLFREFSLVEIYPHGNRIQSVWQFITDIGYIGIPIRTIFNPFFGWINFKETRYPSGFIIYAKK